MLESSVLHSHMNRTLRPAIAKKTIESRQANRPSESDGLPSIGCRAGMHVRGVMGKRKAKSEARMRKSRKRARALESVVQYGTVGRGFEATGRGSATGRAALRDTCAV